MLRGEREREGMARERPVVKRELLSDIISNVIPEEKEVCPVPSSERETGNSRNLLGSSLAVFTQAMVVGELESRNYSSMIVLHWVCNQR